MFYNFLFPRTCRQKGISLLILALRIFAGAMLFIHGLDKLFEFETLSITFPSVLGFGSYMSLMLAIFAEFCCSLFLIFGLLTRLAVIPLIVAMAVAFFDIHDAMLPEGEASLVYLIIFAILYLTGPGRYSVDFLIDSRFRQDKASSSKCCLNNK